ncbi:glycosyltransferase family 2 protein [Cognatishimia sp. SS12]|uniref:glycosyltransferase family 2 protein n=1 Tax=Cognatishimia sp. SS12 TaxID=2979465 RepID=UPI00232F557C|nr:glycosyltransferase family 2 protein [Cognatishimia sp. SS12]
MRLKRRRLLWRAFRARHALTPVKDQTGDLAADDIIAVSVMRNEMTRLPFFLAHYRALGVAQFLIVDNGSDDGSLAYLRAQPDVSLWQTDAGYHAARFGLDWLTWLQFKHAHNRWCLMVDADEVLVYAAQDQVPLKGLTQWLDSQGRRAFGAMMLDLYPKGPVNGQSYTPGDDPRDILQWFDVGPYRAQRQWPLGNLWVQGGVRERVFFAEDPHRSPTLNKLPLVKWHRKFAYVNSCHSILPPKLNYQYAGPGSAGPSGVLLHTKFLPEIAAKSETEKQRKQHFNRPEDFDGYYDQIMTAPDLWHTGSVAYEGPEQLVQFGLMSPPMWTEALLPFQLG